MSSLIEVLRQPGNGALISSFLNVLNISHISSVGPIMPSYFSIDSDMSLN